MVMRSFSWWIATAILSAVFLYGYEKFLMEPIFRAGNTTASEIVRSVRMSRESFSMLVYGLNFAIYATVFLAKAFAALIAVAIMNGLAGRGFSARIGPDDN